MGQIGDQLNEALSPWLTDDLTAYNDALAEMFSEVEQLAFDDEVTGDEGWSIILDPDRCPAKGLPFLAQLVGLRLPLGVSETDARALVKDHANWRRGSNSPEFHEQSPFILAAQRTLKAQLTNLISNPSAETDIAGWTPRVYNDAVVTNLVTNPSFETNTTGWTANAYGGGALTRENGWASSGGWAGRYAKTGTGYCGVMTTMGAPGMPVTAGQAYSGRSRVNILSNPQGLRIVIQWFNGATALTNTYGTIIAAGVTGQQTATFANTIAPATATRAAMNIESADNMAAGETIDFYFDSVLFSPGTLIPDYFDGSTDAPATAWTGTAHASTSTRSNFSISNEQAKYGSKSFRLTRDNDGFGPSSIYMGLDTTHRVAVAPGQYLAVRASFRAATVSRDCFIAIVWYNAGGIAVGNTQSGVTNDITSGWTDVTHITAAAPASAVSAHVRPSVSVGDLVPEGEIHYVDGIAAFVSNSPVTEVPAYFEGTSWADDNPVTHDTPSKQVIIRERDAVACPSDPAYGLTVITYDSETPDPAATEAAIRAVKPAGIILAYHHYPGWDLLSLEAAGYASLAVMEAAYSNVDRLESHT